MKDWAKYNHFKKQMLEKAEYRCEHCGSSEGLTLHHILKQSTYPHLKTAEENVVVLCGACHTELERRIRQGEDIYEFSPYKLENLYGLGYTPQQLKCPSLADRI